MIYENISASYDVGVAKKFGVNCAVLLNKLNYLCQCTTRDDGFCWRTASELENELGLSRTQQELAIKKLEEVGIIETKNTFIIGTQVKCKHFKVLLKSDFYETCKSDLQETYKSVNNNKTIIIKHNNIESKKRFKKPTLDEVEAYCKERNNNVDAKKFYEYYEVNNWKDRDGKQVKNWKQKVITWEGRGVRQVTKIETTPDWFDKDLQINKASIDERKEMEDILNNH